MGIATKIHLHVGRTQDYVLSTIIKFIFFEELGLYTVPEILNVNREISR